MPKTEIGEKEEVVVYATKYLAVLSPVIANASKGWGVFYMLIKEIGLYF